MADLEGDDAFDKVLDRLVELAGAADKAKARETMAEAEVRDLNGKLADVLGQLRQAQEAVKVNFRESDENSELWVAAKELAAKLTSSLGDIGMIAPALAHERDRLNKAIEKTKRLDQIPF